MTLDKVHSALLGALSGADRTFPFPPVCTIECLHLAPSRGIFIRSAPMRRASDLSFSSSEEESLLDIAPRRLLFDT